MARDIYMTLTVRNLPLGTTQQDVEDHIKRMCSDANPVVSPVVKESTRPMVYTTVTIRQDTDYKCKDLRDRLNLTPFFPRRPQNPEVRESKINVSDEFLGVTTVAEHKDPQFDLYFVHGLGGHAFRSWSTDRGFPHMWPRDFLPHDIASRPLNLNDIHGPKLAGRFSTIGYRASALSTSAATTTIERTADNLLNTLRADRVDGCTRPMYFACHSLGGLVTCQALIHTLYAEQERYKTYRNTLFNNDECLVKGIFFFGTPFEGSKLAGYAYKIVRFLKGNEVLIDSLRVRSQGLATIVAKFDQLRNREETKIPVVIAYEMQPMYGIKFVTAPESAMSSFDVQTIGIEGDHKSMIKIGHNQDKSYREFTELMIRTIQDTLSKGVPAPEPPARDTKSEDLQQNTFNPNRPKRSQTVSSFRSTDTLPPYPGPPQSLTFPVEDNKPWISDQKVPCVSEILESPSPLDTRDSWLGTAAPTRDPGVKPVKIENLFQQDLATGKEDKGRFALLTQFDTVFLIDDTGSMAEMEADDSKPKWDELIESLQYIVEIVCSYDKDGVDVHFLCNDGKDEYGITNGQRMLDLLSREVQPDEYGGGTFMAQQIWLVLTTYLDRFEDWKRRVRERPPPQKPKMLNLIVITDGAADDREEVEDVIADAAKRLDALHAPRTQVGIQFLQIGKDEAAARWLVLLDDELKTKHGIRDMVDTRPWDSPKEIDKSFRERLSQIVLGGINRATDSLPA